VGADQGDGRMTSSAIAVALVAARLAVADSARNGEKAASNCDRAYEQLYGRAVVRPGPPGGKTRPAEPKKRRDVSPHWPAQLPASCFAGAGAHEVLVGADGKVERTWLIKAPCSQVATALEEAIRQWEYEPVIVDGKPVPFCMMVATRVHPR
jgi:hypothetical protein